MNKFKQYRQAKTEYAYSLFKNNQSFEKVRAIIIKDGKLLLVHRIKSNIYSLPGGGVEYGENIQIAVERESYEEAKAKVKFKSVVGVLNYNINMTYNNEKFLSSRIEYYCLCDFLGFIKKKKFFGLNGEFFEKVEVVWQSIEQIDKCGLGEYITNKVKKVYEQILKNSKIKENQQNNKNTDKNTVAKGKKVFPFAFIKGNRIKNKKLNQESNGNKNNKKINNVK